MNNLQTVLLVIGIVGVISSLYGMFQGHIAAQVPGLICSSCLIYGYFDPNINPKKSAS